MLLEWALVVLLGGDGLGPSGARHFTLCLSFYVAVGLVKVSKFCFEILHLRQQAPEFIWIPSPDTLHLCGIQILESITHIVQFSNRILGALGSFVILPRDRQLFKLLELGHPINEHLVVHQQILKSGI